MGAFTSRAPAARDPEPQPPLEKGPDLSQLPPELLLLVLSYVPPRVLLRRCRLVCRGWRALVDGQALWLLRVARDHGALLPLVRSCLPRTYCGGPQQLGRFCELRPLGRNLIRNPCGQEGFRKWMVWHDGNGWVVEQNRTSIPGAPSQTCFVSSYRWCHKRQFLDLEEEGLWPELLDSGKIEICVSDWWGGRHDCGCKYCLVVQLLDDNFTVLEEFSVTPEPIPQWNNDAYQQVTHVFSHITGVRFVSFEHWGQDTQFWAGHYGARVTNSSVIVRPVPETTRKRAYRPLQGLRGTRGSPEMPTDASLLPVDF